MKSLLVKGCLLSLFLLTLSSLDAKAQPNYLYTNDNQFFNTVTAFSVAANGALTPVPGSPFLTNGLGAGGGFFAAVRINVSVVGSLLYVTNESSNDISAFTINPATGALTAVPGSPFPTGGFSGGVSGPGTSLAVTPDNRFLYATNPGSVDVSVFSIAANGALTPIAGSPFLLAGVPDGIKLSPDGRFLTIAFVIDDTVGVYAINANGTLTAVPGSPFPSPGIGSVAGLDINCAGTLLYAGQAAFLGTHVDGFNIASNGSLTPVPGSPFASSPGDNSNVVLLSNDERFLFVSNQFSSTVTVFNVAANGSLSPVAGSPFSIGFIFSTSMATNQAGNLLYVDSTGFITVYSIAADGTLTQVPGSPFVATPGGLGSLAAFPPKSCSSFDFCIQDDANGNLIRLNSTTGDYSFMNCRKGITLAGVGKVVKRVSNGFCKVELSDTGPDPKRPDRSVSVAVNPCTGFANAQVTTAKTTFTIGDSNIYNNVCPCH
jgi:6-phosphogluconolactonase (cycloisomerase 2 family)